MSYFSAFFRHFIRVYFNDYHAPNAIRTRHGKQYRKNNPDVFENCLKETIQEKTGLEYVNLKDFFTDNVVETLHRFDTVIYANTSLVNTKVSIPVLITNLEFKGICICI